MKIIKLFLISVVVLSLLLTAFASLLPSQVRISRAIDISDSSLHIWQQVSNMENWEQWNEYIIALAKKTAVKDSIYSKELTVYLVSAGSTLITTRWCQ
ncbi:MAG: hypothetical protein WKF89_19260, partial [Chitinophagaceae bacterium]